MKTYQQDIFNNPFNYTIYKTKKKESNINYIYIYVYLFIYRSVLGMEFIKYQLHQFSLLLLSLSLLTF